MQVEKITNTKKKEDVYGQKCRNLVNEEPCDCSLKKIR